MKSKSYYSLMSMFALSMMSADNFGNTTNRRSNFISDEELELKNNPKYKFNFSIPKSAKLYIFESNGEFETFTEFASRNEMPNYCVFHCVAINDRSALKKFNKWKSSNSVEC